MPAADRISDENSLCRPGTRMAWRPKPGVAHLARAGSSELPCGVGGRRTIALGAARGPGGNPGAWVIAVRLAGLGGAIQGPTFLTGRKVGRGALRAGPSQ